MRLDHVSFAAGPDGLAATTEKIGQLLGAEFLDGGAHPRFGTRNKILPLTGHQYMEIVDVLDHPASEKAAFGQFVRERTQAGGGWMAWCVSVDDMTEVEHRIGRHAVPGNRRRPDGFNLE
ncbi:MAG: VOC family protein, partial [Actinomycetota bacterium]|nr:VOC family protein [Actinomycetota bacterium]